MKDIGQYEPKNNVFLFSGDENIKSYNDQNQNVFTYRN